ncbi:MAG: sigma-70 family RNA polymerase sigma factor [Endomicrobia bacterium]|nr:sigma-70 family RNA polymerase sigma factor [Endomicrobiia bacterium]MCL2799660.1 sigma-70 family RNA polymerase sigma factor [Endomicrobiia bacterium]
MKKRNNIMRFGKEEIKKYKPFVYAIVRKYKTFFPRIDEEELIAEGERGLFEASLRYKKNSAASFSTYAWYRIVKNIQEYISKNISLIEMPQSVRKTFSSIKKIIDNETKSGRTADISKIAKILNLKPSEISDIISRENAVSTTLSLDKEVEIGGQKKTLAEFIEDKSQANIFDSMVQSEDISRLGNMLSNLSEKERKVLSYRLGLGGGKKRVTLKEISSKFGISVSKVKDLEKIALTKLKGMIKEFDD